MITIYHNTRCRKSREGLQILENSGKEFKIVNYLDHPFTEDELRALLKKLKIAPVDLIRTNEAIWKEQYKGKNLADNQIIAAMITYPKLIERPIVVNGNKAVVGRPPENIKNIL